MKKVLFPMIILAVYFPTLLMSQTSGLIEVKCTDYSCNINKAQTALANKQYKDAIDYCRTAKSYPNANASEADAMIYKILESIVAQKKIAEVEKQAALVAQKKGVDEELNASETIKKAKNDAEAASHKKENADNTIKQADNDELKALELIKKADNDIEVATRQKEKAKLDIAQAQNTKEKAKTALAVADYDSKIALDVKKRAESEAENAKREKEKAHDIIANSEKASLAASNLVKEVSNALTGDEAKIEKPQEYMAGKTVEQAIKKETPQVGGIYIATKAPLQMPSKKVDIQVLQKAIDAEKDKSKAFKLQEKLLDSIQLWYQRDTSYRSDLAENYANKAWSALFLRKYSDSEQAARAGLATDGNKPFIKAILGHALLLQGDYDQALSTYIDYMKDGKQLKNKSNRQAIIEDLDVLKQEGISHKDMLKVKTVLLNNKKVN
jgi:hypothetical protein